MKETIAGRNVGLYVEKVAGSGQFTRILCANSLNFEVTTESIESDCVDSAEFGESEPGKITWTAGGDMTVRQATDDATANPAETDATDNITAENLLDYQLAGRKLQLRYQLGTKAKSPRYAGMCFITKNGFSSDNKSNGKNSVAFQSTLR